MTKKGRRVMRNIFWSVLVLIAVLFIFGCEKGSSFIPLCVNEKDTMLRTIVVEELKNFTGDDSWTDGYDWILPEIIQPAFPYSNHFFIFGQIQIKTVIKFFRF